MQDVLLNPSTPSSFATSSSMAGFAAAPGSAAAQLNALPVAAQWAVSAILFVGMIAWLIFGNVASGVLG
eukprot:COSAG01_NODE_26148_length_722_cov_1.504013_1_plen_68_part_01